MSPDQVGDMWRAYKAQTVSQEIHPKDTMYSGGKDWYWSVGESAAQVICAALASGPTGTVTTMLDYGCGYGRVARHLRLLLPQTDLHFCEREPEGVEFCARTFSGIRAENGRLPTNMDLIWVGSVFTHLSCPHMEVLFHTLSSLLAPKGMLIATFHGRRAIHMAEKWPYLERPLWDTIVQQYRATGFGYSDYSWEGFTDYGVSLSSAARVLQLGDRYPALRLVSYQEAGWAQHQDVAVWSKDPLALD